MFVQLDHMSACPAEFHLEKRKIAWPHGQRLDGKEPIWLEITGCRVRSAAQRAYHIEHLLGISEFPQEKARPPLKLIAYSSFVGLIMDRDGTAFWRNYHSGMCQDFLERFWKSCDEQSCQPALSVGGQFFCQQLFSNVSQCWSHGLRVAPMELHSWIRRFGRDNVHSMVQAG